MAQRVLIAGAVSCNPDLLIADEPTTALDVTVQAEAAGPDPRPAGRSAEWAVILVTHNFGVVADLCDRVAVMKAGRIVEAAEVGELFASPQDSYTRILLASTLEGERGARPSHRQVPRQPHPKPTRRGNSDDRDDGTVEFAAGNEQGAPRHRRADRRVPAQGAPQPAFRALHGVSLHIAAGETLVSSANPARARPPSDVLSSDSHRSPAASSGSTGVRSAAFPSGSDGH